MDDVLAKTLKANLKSAHTAGEKVNAIILALISVIDCLLSVATKTNKMYETTNRIKWLGRIMQGIGQAGGFALFVALLKKAGIL